GLENATITITTTGSPSWESAGSPLAPSRVYVPPKPSEASIRAMQNQVNVALNRPCGASSESENHFARFANDGNEESTWFANEPLARWWVDLEGFYQLASLKLRFANEANFRFVIETSNDGDGWNVVIDRHLTDSIRAERNELFPPGTV